MKSYAYLLAAGVSLVAFASAAHAADLLVEGPGPIQYAAPAHSWDGMYVGAFGGYQWANADFDFDENSPQGWLLGVNAGANFTLSEGIVAGVVGDIAWTNAADSSSGPVWTVESSMDWVGSLRGRVGFDGGAFLPYLTAGVAFAHNTIDLASIGPNGTDDQVHVGWTVGAGLEVEVAENVSLDLLYRYSDYGTKTYSFTGGDVDASITAHQVTAGVNIGF